MVVRALAETTTTDVALFYWESTPDEVAVQWTNIRSAARLRRWSRAIADAANYCRSPQVGMANATMLRGRNQALVVA
jgi:orotate phosphoribosyltransferase-like protein